MLSFTYSNGKRTDYDGGRTRDEIVSWIKTAAAEKELPQANSEVQPVSLIEFDEQPITFKVNEEK